MPNFSLTPDEVRQFHDDGFLGPFAAVDVDEMQRLDPLIQAEVFETEGPNPNNPVASRHMDSPLVYGLASRPEIVDRVASIFGPDLVLWATYFWDKPPGGKEIPWHQDGNYWPLEPVLNISAWIAVDRVTTENSCVQVIPGSHKAMLPHIQADEDMAFAEMADPALFDSSKAVDMELEPGDFFLFNEKLLHHSEPNRSDKRRRGMTARITIPIVRIAQDGPPLHPGHACILLRGQDPMHFNRLCEPPA